MFSFLPLTWRQQLDLFYYLMKQTGGLMSSEVFSRIMITLNFDPQYLESLIQSRLSYLIFAFIWSCCGYLGLI